MEIKLNRTGRRPFGFVGEHVVDGDTRDHSSVRWDKIRLYRKGKEDVYVMGIARITVMEGERDFFQVRQFTGKGALMTFVKKRLPYLEEKIRNSLNGK